MIVRQDVPVAPDDLARAGAAGGPFARRDRHHRRKRLVGDAGGIADGRGRARGATSSDDDPSRAGQPSPKPPTWMPLATHGLTGHLFSSAALALRVVSTVLTPIRRRPRSVHVRSASIERDRGPSGHHTHRVNHL